MPQCSVFRGSLLGVPPPPLRRRIYPATIPSPVVHTSDPMTWMPPPLPPLMVIYDRMDGPQHGSASSYLCVCHMRTAFKYEGRWILLYFVRQTGLHKGPPPTHPIAGLISTMYPPPRLIALVPPFRPSMRCNSLAPQDQWADWKIVWIAFEIMIHSLNVWSVHKIFAKEEYCWPLLFVL